MLGEASHRVGSLTSLTFLYCEEAQVHHLQREMDREGSRELNGQPRPDLEREGRDHFGPPAELVFESTPADT